MKTFILSCLLCCGFTTASAQTDVLQAARQTNDYFMAKYSDPTQPTNVKKIRPSSLWTRAVYYEGLMALYNIDPQQRYLDYTEQWADFHQWTPRNGTKTTDADDQCCEQTYIEYNLLKGKGTLEPTKENLEKQMATERYDYWTWIDAIQMALPVYIKMYAITQDKRYLDYGMKSYRWTRNECGGGCFNVKEGLWWRDKDFVAPYKEKDGKNCYWSRGNGWVYAALVRSMNELPKKSKEYKELKKDFLLMSKALLECQHDDGFVGYPSWFTERCPVPSCLRQGMAGSEELSPQRRVPGMESRHRKGALSRSASHLHICTRLRRLWNGLLPARTF